MNPSYEYTNNLCNAVDLIRHKTNNLQPVTSILYLLQEKEL
jgi:hypothetical protein